MAKFLNTDLLNEWIPRLIEETERELFIVVPYIKISERVFKCLKEADERDVETTLIYREDKLSFTEKKKLSALNNLNLMHHPNVHAKCFYNEKYMLIGSMNLYEYSEKNNREMGVLLHRFDIGTTRRTHGGGADDESIFQDAIKEIKHIVNGAHIEKQSRETMDEGFDMDIIKTKEELTTEFCRKVNKVFLNKRFEAYDKGYDWVAICHNYFDKIDVILAHRVEIIFNRDMEWINALYNKAKHTIDEYRFSGFKFYWNPKSNIITLYNNSKDTIWDTMNETEQLRFKKKGIDAVIRYLREFMQ
jgi:hypothetical protein